MSYLINFDRGDGRLELALFVEIQILYDSFNCLIEGILLLLLQLLVQDFNFFQVLAALKLELFQRFRYLFSSHFEALHYCLILKFKSLLNQS